MERSITEMEKQTIHLERSVAAAKTSADIAAAVSIPTLLIEKFETENMGAANLEATLKYPNVSVVIKNYGQTPAFLRSWNIVFTCEDLPPVPEYWSQPGTGEKPPGAGIVLERVAVRTNEPYSLPMLHSWQRTEFSLEDVRAIIAHKKKLWAYGFICYYDLFRGPLQRMKFCEMALDFQAGWIHWVSGFEPSEAYRGTDDYPFRKSTTGERIEGQTNSTNAKADDQPEQAN
jgi:hypothetical protein